MDVAGLVKVRGFLDKGWWTGVTAAVTDETVNRCGRLTENWLTKGEVAGSRGEHKHWSNKIFYYFLFSFIKKKTKKKTSKIF